MNPQILLEKIIEKAVRNGWEAPKSYTAYEATDNGKYWRAAFDDYYNVETFFFDHSFAKALFTENIVCGICGSQGKVMENCSSACNFHCDENSDHWDTKSKEPAWSYHLRILALTPPEERLSYLGKYL